MFVFVYHHLKVIFSNNTRDTKKSLVLLYSRNYTAGIEGHYNEYLDCSGYPQIKSLLNQAAPQENTCQIFQPKKSRNHTPKIL